MILLFFILFLNLKSETILFENKNDLFFLKVGIFDQNEELLEYKNFSNSNQVNNEFYDPFSDEYIETIKIKTWPFSGSTSRILYLGYPISNIGGSTNKYPNTYEAGIVAFDLKNFNLSSYFITNKNGLGWKIGSPNQKNFISLNMFNDNIILGSTSGPNFLNFKNDHSVANVIIGNNLFSSLDDFFNNSANTSLGYFNNPPSNVKCPIYFNSINDSGFSFFNTIIGSFNLLSGISSMPFSNEFFYKNSLLHSKNVNSNFNCIFGNGNLKTVGNDTANRHNILIGNSNMRGAKECNHNIIIGESNLISNRDDKNNFLNLENNIFIGFDILGKGFLVKNNAGIKESIFILPKNDTVYDPLDYINQDGITGSIFIGTYDPTNNINKSNKTYISNVKNQFDNDDFKIGKDNPPQVLLSNKDNRIGTIPIIFDSNLYTILNDAQFFNDSLSELLSLSIKSANLKLSLGQKTAFFFIDTSAMTKITNPILSNFIIYDEKQNPIGYEPIYLIPLLIKAIQNFSDTDTDTKDNLIVLNKLTASNINTTDSINSNIGNSNGTVDINGSNINMNLAVGSVNIGKLNSNNINVEGSSNCTIGNSNAALDINGSSINMNLTIGSVNIGKLNSDKINIEGATDCLIGNLNKKIYLTGSNININSIDQIVVPNGDTSIGNFNGTSKIFGKKIILSSDKDNYNNIIDNTNSLTNILISTKQKGKIVYDYDSDRNISLCTNYEDTYYAQTLSVNAIQRNILLFTGKPSDSSVKILNINKVQDSIVLKSGNNQNQNLNIDGTKVINGKMIGLNSIILIGDTYINPSGTGILNINNVPNISSGDSYNYLLIDSAGNIFQGLNTVQGSTIPSSKRFKENIENIKIDKEIFEKLTPVSFNYKKDFGNDQSKKWGLIAEDVLNSGFKDAVLFDKNGEVYGIDYNVILMALMYRYLQTCKELEDLKNNIELK